MGDRRRTTIQTVIADLESDTIKKRQEGLVSLQHIFSRPDAVNNFVGDDGKVDAKPWIKLFQAVFLCVLKEKTALQKKVSTAAEKRLGEAARTLRWLVEKTVHLMSSKVTKVVYEHLSSMMVNKGQLFAPVALDYIKAFQTILDYAPHMDHLSPNTWVDLVERSFNVILKDSIRSSLFDIDNDEPETPSTAPSPASTDRGDGLFEEDSEMQVDTENTTPRPKKRRREEEAQPSSSMLSQQKAPNSRVAVSSEQVAFASLLATLVASPYAPFNSDAYPELNASILNRLQRFLQMYPVDATLHHDFLRILTSTLNHISYNSVSIVTEFATNNWDSLVNLWVPKNKGLKEGLVCVFRLLFPFLTSSPSLSRYSDKLWNLWNVLSLEGESRGSVLLMESLRLEIRAHSSRDPAAFVASSFRAGERFGWAGEKTDRSQAMTWAVLELQADCAQKLYHHSESVHTLSGPSRPTQGHGKRARIENPLSIVLSTIRNQTSAITRIYHLQILLFFIDRHWDALNREMKLEVFTTLLQFISVDDKDGALQGWIMMCFAAIATADFASGNVSSYLSSSQGIENSSFSSLLATQSLRDSVASWEQVWTHSIRRTNTTTLCRPACHAALALLSHPALQSTRKSSARPPISPQRVVADIEAMLKDLDVQGPSSPYDSVCSFLSLCLQVVNQDVRLFRLQLEEKVLSWLTGFWQLGRIDVIVPQLHLPTDVLLLLETICSTSKHSALLTDISLPPSPIVETLVTTERMRTIREFVLDARLPEFNPVRDSGELPVQGDGADSGHSPSSADVTEPQARERRISAFFLKTIESLTPQWQALDTGNRRADVAKHLLDIIVIALSFEGVLYLNGIRWDARLIHASCNLMSQITPALTYTTWTMDEKCQVLKALEPLITTSQGDPPWTALVTAKESTGVRYEVLRTLTESSTEMASVRTMQHLQLLWTNLDVQACFGDLLTSLRTALDKAARQDSSGQGKTIDVDDGFGPIKTSDAPVETSSLDKDRSPLTQFMGLGIRFLSVVPLLQSSSGEPTRDNDLLDLVVGARADLFLQIAPSYLSGVRDSSLYLSFNGLDRLLDTWGEIGSTYSHSRNVQITLLAIDLLDASMPIWLSPSPSASNEQTCDRVHEIMEWFLSRINSRFQEDDEPRVNRLEWKVRDAFARFLEKYLENDPSQRFWARMENDEALRPSDVVQRMNGDDDIRVRFRVAIISARLFEFAANASVNLMLLYEGLRKCYSKDIERSEHIITRIISLGNIMILSSAIRRAPYWHLLEICLHSDAYTSHLEATLRQVSERIGVKPFSALFGAYASQIAFSIRKAEKSVLRIPFYLLGYRDAKERAIATFKPFTPANISKDETSMEHGRQLFRGHCEAIQKKPEDGLWECFGDIFAQTILSWISNTCTPKDFDLSLDDRVLFPELAYTFERPEAELRQALGMKLDNVVSSILRAIGDQDISPNGPIVEAMRSSKPDGGILAVFSMLTQYRSVTSAHDPNLPRFPTWVILIALHNVLRWVKGVDLDSLTYHVLQELFSLVEASLMVHEQHRLTNAITVWIALQHERFQSHSLLHAVIRGQCSSLGQVDMARSAQSILEWCFARYHDNGHPDPRFPDILVQIACVCRDYSIESHNAAVSEMGTDLLSWINSQAVAISKQPRLTEQVKVALTAWPHAVPSRLQDLSSISTEELSEILNGDYITSNKFRIVQRLNEASLRGSDISRFAQYDFWNLKDCVPPTEKLSIDDVLSFSSLLLLNRGSISSFGSEQLLSGSKNGHVRGQRATYNPVQTPEHAIIHALLTLLECGDPMRRHSAYLTLRALLRKHRVKSDEWPDRYIAELKYLEQFDPPLSSHRKRELTELTTPQFLEASGDFKAWIGIFSLLLSELLAETNNFYAQLSVILKSDAQFAEEALPIFIRTLLLDTGQRPVYTKALSEYFSRILRMDGTTVSCRRCIIEIVLHLRNVNPTSKDALAHEKWLVIDYLLLAQNAVVCGAYTTALLFLELGHDQRNSSAEFRESPSNDSSFGTDVEKVMYDIYAKIDEPDGFYGIKTQNHHVFLMKRFHHERQWDKAFRFHGAALEADTGDRAEAEGLLQSFHSYGFDHLATGTLLNSMASGQPNVALSYQLGWRTETWDLPQLESENCPGASLYFALRAIHRERDHRVSESVVKGALFRETALLRSLGPENIAQIREVTQNLMSLNQITTWLALLTKTPESVLQAFNNLSESGSGFEFSDVGNIMATRISLVRSVRLREERQQIGSLRSPLAQALLDGEKECLLQLSSLAREAKHSQIALNSITRARKLENSPSFAVIKEHAFVLWSHQEEKLAVDLLKDLRLRLPSIDEGDVQTALQRASLNASLGTWTAEACLEKHSEIWRDFFEKALELIQKTSRSTQGEGRASVYHKMAIFADHQYYAIVRSPDFLRWKVYLARKDKELEELRGRYKSSTSGPDQNDIRSAIARSQKVAAQDRQATQQYSTDQERYLKYAIEMYSRCLEESDTFNHDTPIRLCSLWLSNFTDPSMTLHFGKALDRVPSRKFVFLAHQLTARVSGENDEPQAVLERLILRMSVEHPFHTLYQVLLLSPPRDDANASRRASARHSRNSPSNSQMAERRTTAAKGILNRLRNDKKIQNRLLSVEQLCSASLEWADHPIKNDHSIKSGVRHKIPTTLKITKLRHTKVPVLTIHTPIDPSMRYDNCIWVDRYNPEYTTAGGLSKPKICECKGSDGNIYKQLFKGEESDDLRQDAVMEQVFQLVNGVLQRDSETRRRQLRVRDYKVVPLDTQAGVLQFVDSTMPLRSWLTGAHVKYRPKDEHPSIVAKRWGELSKKNDSKEIYKDINARVDEYRKTRAKFRPVMRYWFTETHKVPISWFAMRLNYTRSVATTSIVGHVLGLGDRHTSNILLDSTSGEVVHIDLGMAFDQSKLLPVPERVPFRMTEDMEDGMGMSGTEGVFQRCAEETMRVLREGSEIIMTVLEVFRHDPLHSWTMSDLKIQKVQQPSKNTAPGVRDPGIGIDMASGNAEEDADRALSSVARKLDKTLSVATTVRGLVAEAKDPANIASLYHGWGPFY